jgi:hypothetical protein
MTAIPPNEKLLLVAGLVGIVLIAHARKTAAAPPAGTVTTQPAQPASPLSGVLTGLLSKVGVMTTNPNAPSDGGSAATGGFFNDPSYQDNSAPVPYVADTSASGSPPLPSSGYDYGSTQDDGYGFGG